MAPQYRPRFRGVCLLSRDGAGKRSRGSPCVHWRYGNPIIKVRPAPLCEAVWQRRRSCLRTGSLTWFWAGSSRWLYSPLCCWARRRRRSASRWRSRARAPRPAVLNTTSAGLPPRARRGAMRSLPPACSAASRGEGSPCRPRPTVQFLTMITHMRRGPWAPTTSLPPISAVRDGPDIILTVRGMARSPKRARTLSQASS